MRKVLILALLGILTTPLFSGETREVAFERGKTLAINLKPGGSISIDAWDESKVRIDYEFKGGDQENFEVSIQDTASKLQILGDYIEKRRSSRGGINLKLTVPRILDIELKTSGGNVTIANVEGFVEGKTMGGKIRLDGVVGDVDLTTMGGGIVVNDSDLAGQLETYGGDVEFNRVRGPVSAVTKGGDLDYRSAEIEATETADSGEVVHLKTMGGDISVDNLYFAGELKTMGGDIEIGSAMSGAQVKTMGGDIEIGELWGSLQASTMGGDVSVQASGEGDIEIESKGGTIHLTLPSNFSATFDVALSLSKRARRDFSIQSDFSLTENEEDQNSKKGSNRRTLTASGKVGSGANRVFIRTIDGNIVIKKAD